MNICLLNDSFPPLIDGVANAVVNYAENLKKHNNNPIVVTPKYPDGDTDAKYNFPILRYPGIDVRDRVGYVAGYPFSPRVISSLKESHVELLHSHCPVASTVLARSMKVHLNVPLILTTNTLILTTNPSTLATNTLTLTTNSLTLATFSFCPK